MNEHVGSLIVEAKIDESGIDKGIDNINKKLQQLDEKRGKHFVYTSEGAGETVYDRELTEEEQRYKERLEATLTKLEEKRVTLETNKILEEQTTAETTKQADNLYRLVNGVMTTADGKRYVLKAEEEITQEEEKQNEETRKHIANLDKVGSSMQKIIKKVTKWALAIIGVRGAYGAIRKAINAVKSQNEEIANTFKVMQVAVGNALTPLVQKIVNIIKNLMLYIDYIYFRLTNKHLFDFSKAFADANKSASGIAKSTDKFTASFDEMNIIQDTSGGGAGGGIATNPFEGWENFKPPQWLEKLMDIVKKVTDFVSKHWKTMVGVIAGGVAILLGLKIFKFFKDLGGGSEVAKDLGTSFTGFFDGLGKGIEAIAILGGLALVIKSVTDLITAFSASGLEVNDVLGLMGTIIGSLVVLITALTIGANALQSPLAMAGLLVLTGAISAILLVIEKTLPTILNAVADFIVKIGPTLNQTLEVIGTNIEKIIKALGTSLPPILNSTSNLFDKVFGGISKVIQTIGNTVTNVMRTAKDLVTSVLNAILNFINRLGPAINNFVDNAIRAVTKLINFMISGIEYLVNTLVIRAVNKMIEAINKVGEYVGVEIPTVKQVSIPRFVPKFAKGTILNAPGKGVPVGGYQGLAGEAGREAYLPLSDRQLLEELGSTIGKYVVINATIPVQVGNRLVLREMRRIQAEDDFAYNS